MGTTQKVAIAALVVFAAACSDVADDPAQAQTSSTVADPSVEVSTSSAVGTDGPPPLHVDNGHSTVATRGYDYCWTPGGCADSFGAETPTPVDVDTPTVLISWIDDGVLTAGYRADDQECFARLSLEAVGKGTWSLAVPPAPGTHRIDLHGESAAGTTGFSLLVSSTVAGPPLLPIASVGWPDTNDSFLIGAGLYGIDPDSEAHIEIVSADGILTVLQMELYSHPPDAECVQWFEGESTAVDGIGALGVAPLQATLRLRSATEQYEMSWEWPRDLGPDDSVTRTLRPTTEAAITEVDLVGAGWSFGMCGGFCLAELEIDMTQASLSGSSRVGDGPLFINEGVLTELAVARINSSLDMLDGVALEPVYGCPDCADGGAAYLIIDRHDVATRYWMDFGRPPDELAGLYETAFAIVDALVSCKGNDLVAVSDTCQPQQR